MGAIKSCGIAVAIVAIIMGMAFQYFVVRESAAWRQELHINGSFIRFARLPNSGAMEIWGDDDTALARGLGYAHAKDRYMQLIFQRLLVQGRLSECLASSPNTIKIDTFFRELGFTNQVAREIKTFKAPQLAFLEAYTEGINHYVIEEKRAWFSWDFLALPMEFTLLGYTPEPWQIVDTLATVKLMSYVGLANTQEQMEKWIMHVIRQGGDVAKLKQLLSPHLDGLNDEMLALIQNVKLEQSLLYGIPSVLAKEIPIIAPTIKASNNWVISPKHTESKQAMQCNDPHLEINRLPGVWYEVLYHYNDSPDHFWFGVTVPGVPGFIFGRSHHISYGLTYGFMDQIDYFFEEVKDNKYKRVGDDGTVTWHQFDTRIEILKQKDKPANESVKLVFFSNENGLLELKDNQIRGNETTKQLYNGVYLLRKWSCEVMKGSDLESYVPPMQAKTVKETQALLSTAALSTNFLISDKTGNIGYQQGGRAPLRGVNHTHALLPGIGWKAGYSWRGFAKGADMNSIYNPPEGWIITANNDMQAKDPAKPRTINVHMGNYRVQRAEEMLRGMRDTGHKMGFNDMRRMQMDVHSKQAEDYLQIIRSYIPPTPAGNVLLNWDLKYSTDSKGAYLFQEFHDAILAHVFGANWLGAKFHEITVQTTGFYNCFHHYFDRVMLQDDIEDGVDWWGAENSPNARENVMRAILEKQLSTLRYKSAHDIPTWGQSHNFTMNHIMFDGKMPSLLGFDLGPFPLQGHPTTLSQGSVFVSVGRQSGFAPSWRYITDMATDEAYTSMPGGPSARRFSGLYENSAKYFAGEYNHVAFVDTAKN